MQSNLQSLLKTPELEQKGHSPETSFIMGEIMYPHSLGMHQLRGNAIMAQLLQTTSILPVGILWVFFISDSRTLVSLNVQSETLLCFFDTVAAEEGRRCIYVLSCHVL